MVQQIVETIRQSEPNIYGIPGRGWTLKKLQRWVAEKVKKVVSRSTLHAMLHAADLSWKKCKKLLGKRNPTKRAAFMERFASLYERVVHRDVVLIYVD